MPTVPSGATDPAEPVPDRDEDLGPDPSGEPTGPGLREAAYEAELATGTRERTKEQVRRNIVVRIAIIAFGALVTLLGLGMLVLPGPGIVVVIAGLGILATEVTWAERLLAYAKRKAKVDEITAQRPWVKPVSIAVMVVAVAVSVFYALSSL